jgi:hypothetical protein
METKTFWGVTIVISQAETKEARQREYGQMAHIYFDNYPKRRAYEWMETFTQ